MSNYLNRRNNDLDLFEDEDPFFANFFNVFSKDGSKLMRTDIKETEKDYVILIDVPGFDKKDIKLSLDKKYLTVTATSSKEEKDHNSKYLRKERFYGTCSRSYYVGEIEQKDIKASFENGVLSIVLPKQDYQKVEEKKYIEID